MIEKAELQRLAGKTGHRIEVLEKDYALTWALKALYDDERLRKYLIFKGGTCLNKIYFPETWRLSEDLDFSVDTRHDIKPEQFKPLLEAALKKANEQGAPNLDLDHCFDNGEFVRARVKYKRIIDITSTTTPAAVIKIEVSRSEKVLYAPDNKTVHHSYSDPAPFAVKCYPIQEVFIEKLRTIIQRSYCRDYYDVWQLTSMDAAKIGFNDFEGHAHEALRKKCVMNNKAYEPEKIFAKDRLEEARNEWKNQLERLVKPPIPAFEEVVGQLEERFPAEKALSTFHDYPDTEATRTIAYNARQNEYLAYRAIELLGRHLESKKPGTVELALEATASFAALGPLFARKILAKYEETIKNINRRPDQSLKMKTGRVLRDLQTLAKSGIPPKD